MGVAQGDQDLFAITGYDLMAASFPERTDVPVVKVKQARGGSGFPSLLLLPKEKFQQEDLPRIAELLSDDSAWQRHPDAVDIIIGGLLLGDGSEHTLRYQSAQGRPSLSVNVYGVVLLEMPDGNQVFVGRVAEGGKNVPVDTPEVEPLLQAEPGGVAALSAYKNEAGDRFGSRFTLTLPNAQGSTATTTPTPTR